MKTAEDGTIIEFLLGTHSYEGVWLGSKHPARKGAFWWREVLREFAASHPPDAPVSGEELTEEKILQAADKFMARYGCDNRFVFIDGVKWALSATLPTREQEAKDKKSNKTVEICTRSIGGDVYVNYRREFGSDEANHLMKLVDDNIAKYGDESNYFYRIV